uniref:Marginal zone B and B1 cell specific protein n=1 Tax=Pipistrellus kuhlii TaxID=59472 RepID=A0A7J7XBF1_PIPKU|nr:marginal zone B and B1 cell specific protein [Pipistrellus kuhlii]
MRLPLPLLLLLLGAWAIPRGLGNRDSLTATAPELDDEEKYSAHMPTHLRCDACKAVAYQSLNPDSQPLLVPDVATSGKGRGQASHLRGASAAERVGVYRCPGTELLPGLAGLRGPRSEPGEASHGPGT